MTTLAELHRAVAAAVATGRIGKVVFVRYAAQGLLDGEGKNANDTIANAAAVVADWIGQPPEQVYAMLPDKADMRSPRTITLRFAGGATAMVSSAAGPSSAASGVDIMVIGNRGAIYHAYDGGSLHGWEGTQPSMGQHPAIEPIRDALAASMSKGRPVPVGKVEKPSVPKPPIPAKRQAKYGVLLVTGGQTHQENYAEAFAADPRCRLVALTDEPDISPRRRDLNEKLAWSLGVPYIVDIGEALKRKDVDIVSVCTEPERRGRVIVRCAEAGKHLYLDKSLVPQLADADRIAAAVKKSGVKSHMFTMILQPWAREAKKLVEAKKLGTLVAIHADAFFAKGETGTAKLGTPRKEEYPPQRHQLVEAKREFDNVGVYAIAFIHWLTGKRFSSVWGVTGNYFFAEHQKHNVEDFAALSGKLDGGLPVTVAGGRFGWTSHPAGGVNRVILVGTERTLIVDANRPRLELSTTETPWVPPNVHPDDPMGFWKSTMEQVHAQPKKAWVNIGPPAQSDASYFVDCLEAGRESEMSVIEAAHAAEVLLATYKSAATDEVVSLPLPRK